MSENEHETKISRSGLLTRAMGLQPVERRKVKVDVSEWGNPGEETFAYVREMLTSEREEYEKLVERANEDSKVVGKITEAQRAILACMVLCDESGELIFRPEDAAVLMQKPIKVLYRIYKKSLELDGFYELAKVDEKNH